MPRARKNPPRLGRKKGPYTEKDEKEGEDIPDNSTDDADEFGSEDEEPEPPAPQGEAARQGNTFKVIVR